MDFQFTLFPGNRLASSGATGSLEWPFLRAWRDRLYAGRCCRALRALHAQAEAAEPAVRGMPLYTRVVRTYLGCDESAAAMVIECAVDSYAIWPQHRAVRFRDVARYLVADGLCQESDGHGWVGIDLNPVVNRWVPSNW